jgi:hypothetical protein
MINKNSERMGKMNALLWEEFEDRKGREVWDGSFSDLLQAPPFPGGIVEAAIGIPEHGASPTLCWLLCCSDGLCRSCWEQAESRHRYPVLVRPRWMRDHMTEALTQ